MKGIGKKKNLKKDRQVFTNIFLGDIDKEAKWVKIFGLVGIIGFFIILAFAGIIKINLTVPASGKVKNINERIIILSDISKRYIPVVKEDQNVKVYIEKLNRRGKMVLWGKLSKLFEISPEGNVKGEVIIDLKLKKNVGIDTTLIDKNSKVKMRIITSQYSILDLLISKKE